MSAVRYRAGIHNDELSWVQGVVEQKSNGKTLILFWLRLLLHPFRNTFSGNFVEGVQPVFSRQNFESDLVRYFLFTHKRRKALKDCLFLSLPFLLLGERELLLRMYIANFSQVSVYESSFVRSFHFSLSFCLFSLPLVTF